MFLDALRSVQAAKEKLQKNLTIISKGVILIIVNYFAPVAQLDRASAF